MPRQPKESISDFPALLCFLHRLRVLSLGTCTGRKASLAWIFLMLNFSLPFYTLISSSTADHNLPFAFLCVCLSVSGAENNKNDIFGF
jgi:hypothetical protein